MALRFSEEPRKGVGVGGFGPSAGGLRLGGFGFVSGFVSDGADDSLPSPDRPEDVDIEHALSVSCN